MSHPFLLALHRSDYFNADFDLQYRWYLREVGEDLAERYLAAVVSTLNELARQPGLGRPRNFRHPELKELRSCRVYAPVGVHLIFYRAGGTELSAERIMHGDRDLPRRVIAPPDTDLD